MKGKSKSGNGKEWLFIASGLALILAVSLIDGFTFSFVNAIQHIIFDLTAEIKVHAYIAGLVLLMYGLYKRSRS